MGNLILGICLWAFGFFVYIVASNDSDYKKFIYQNTSLVLALTGMLIAGLGAGMMFP